MNENEISGIVVDSSIHRELGPGLLESVHKVGEEAGFAAELRRTFDEGRHR